MPIVPDVLISNSSVEGVEGEANVFLHHFVRGRRISNGYSGIHWARRRRHFHGQGAIHGMRDARGTLYCIRAPH